MRWSLSFGRFSGRCRSSVVHRFDLPRSLRAEPLEDRRLLALVPELVADINPAGTFGDISQIVALGDVALFVADDGEHGAELWRSDGTDEGTLLLADLNPEGGSLPLFMAPLGDYWLFTADDGAHGRELWRTDGTAEGTELVADLAPGVGTSFDSPFAQQVTASESWVYFTLEKEHGRDRTLLTQLWRTDGTTAGTTLRDTLPYNGDLNHRTSFGVREMVVTENDTVFMAYDDGAIGLELWYLYVRQTDQGESRELRQIDISNAVDGGRRLDGEPRELTAVGNFAYFTAYKVSTGRELYEVEMDVNGLQGLVTHSIVPGPGHGFAEKLTVVGADLYFLSYDDVAGRAGLWKRASAAIADGIPPERIVEIPIQELAGASSGLDDSLIAANGRAYFVSLTPGSDYISRLGRRLWTSDGTTEGTQPIVSFEYEGAFDGSGTLPLILEMAALGSNVYFSGYNLATGRELWTSDGTAEGTHIVRDLVSGPESASPRLLTVVADRLFFTAADATGERGLWVSDGTEAHTRAIAMPRKGLRGSHPNQLAVVGGDLLFAADDGVHGRELWKLDGATNDHGLVKDLIPGVDSGIGRFTIDPGDVNVFQGEYYFHASGANLRDSLWKSDGTDEGTINLGLGRDVNVSNPFEVVGDALFYKQFGALYALSTADEVPVLIARPIGVRHDSNSFPQAQALSRGGEAFVFVEASDEGLLLKSTDGTLAGTRVVGPIVQDWNIVTDFLAAGQHAFVLTRAGTSTRPYAYDLVTGTSKLMKYMDEVDFGLTPHNLMELNQELLFTINSLEGNRYSVELWKSDGISDPPPRVPPNGAELLRDFQNGAVTEGPMLTHVMDNTLFMAINAQRNNQSFVQLWRSNGTAEGTVLLHEFNVNSFDDYPNQFTEANGQLYFAMYDQEHGEELWRTDGTPEGTSLVADIAPGAWNAKILNLTAVNDTLFFSADDQVHGSELWRSDGTAAGTFMVADLATREFPYNSSYPHDFVAFQGSLYFGARDDLHGDELFKITPPAGDTNFDGLVDLTDLNNVRNNFGSSGLGDANGDGVVDIADLNAVRNHFGGEEMPLASVGPRFDALPVVPSRIDRAAQLAATDVLFTADAGDCTTPLRAASLREKRQRR